VPARTLEPYASCRMELIGVMNNINHSFGKRAIRLCSEGAEQRWRTRTNSKSPNYTTQITDLAIAKAG
jgi:hypothetical protein